MAIYSKNHTSDIFGYLKEIDSFGNSATFFTSVTEKVGLYADITKKNIGYGNLLWDAKYGKLSSKKHLKGIWQKWRPNFNAIQIWQILL